MSNLAGSPVEGISVQCFEDDVVDICSELEKFLNLRVERGCDFYHKLKRIDISVTALDDTRIFTEQETEERIAAARRLQAYCNDLQLASIVDKLIAEGSASSSLPIVLHLHLCADTWVVTAITSGLMLLFKSQEDHKFTTSSKEPTVVNWSRKEGDAKTLSYY